MKTCCFDTNETKTGLIGKKQMCLYFSGREVEGLDQIIVLHQERQVRLQELSKQRHQEFKTEPGSFFPNIRDNFQLV
jgi:hypothetical protein